MAQVGVVGASGFTGAELLRLVAAHPELDLAVATADSQAGTPVADLYPSLAAAYGGLVLESYDASGLAGLDVVFCCLPHGHSQDVVPELKDKVGHIVDLAADFRLKDPALYPQWYGEAHRAPDLLGDFVYGLPELFRDELLAAPLIAVPGCYPTTASLALAPLLRAGMIQSTGIIVDAASGVSGAGRGKFPFCSTDEDFVAYGLLDHRHTPEIEQTLDATVLFTPHLAPMNRGILATCYARPTASTSTSELLACLAEDYANDLFIVVREQPPSTKATLGSNTAHLTARYDERTGTVVALGALDNLVKGASGQAVQCANLALGLDETLGLPTVGVYP
ncbi:MAG: N-acetyl-gamma-glutamyl-phosphate reductase [Acidimicrobiales bacterium]